MNRNEKTVFGLHPNTVHEKSDPNANLDRNRSRGKSTREALLLAELRAALKSAGRDNEPFTIYLSLNERPDVDMFRRFAEAGVTDFVCAPWMFVTVDPGTPDDKALADRLGAVKWFAEEIVAKV